MVRNYRIPGYADIPRTDVLLVDSTDSVGPQRSKGMAECCINLVAPALANARQRTRPRGFSGTGGSAGAGSRSPS